MLFQEARKQVYDKGKALAGSFRRVELAAPEHDLEPACAKSCPTRSIRFGPIEDLRAEARARVEALHARGFGKARLWGAERLKAYRDSFQELKGNKQVCETTVSFGQNMLLADRSGMDDILEAIRRIQAHSAELAKA